MSFINWGNETPEQREFRRRMEDREFFQSVLAKKIFEARGATSSASAASAGAAGSGTPPVFNDYVIARPTLEFPSASLYFQASSITDIFIDWGDGNNESILEDTGLYFYHEYESAGEYQITITCNSRS